MTDYHSISICGLSRALNRFISGIDGIERLIGKEAPFTMPRWMISIFTGKRER